MIVLHRYYVRCPEKHSVLKYLFPLSYLNDEFLNERNVHLIFSTTR